MSELPQARRIMPAKTKDIVNSGPSTVAATGCVAKINSITWFARSNMSARLVDQLLSWSYLPGRSMITRKCTAAGSIRQVCPHAVTLVLAAALSSAAVRAIAVALASPPPPIHSPGAARCGPWQTGVMRVDGTPSPQFRILTRERARGLAADQRMGTLAGGRSTH